MRGLRRPLGIGAAALTGLALATGPAFGQLRSMVQVEGHDMRVVSAGLETRNPRQPVVVFESGAGTPVRYWDPILPSVASFAPVVAYDRSGIGESAWNGMESTPRQVATRLRTLLSELGVAPPYVLVGHSWGGPLIRFFAGMYPDQVVGMVYIDPTDFMWTPADERALFESLGPNVAWAEHRESMRQAESEGLARMLHPGRRAEYKALLDFQKLELNERALPAVPNVPTSVISAARRPAPPAPNWPVDLKAFEAARRDTRDANLRSWVKEGGEYVRASTTEHFVHHQEPQLVVDLIRRITLGVN